MRRLMMLILGVMAVRAVSNFLEDAEKAHKPGRSRTDEAVAAMARRRAPRRRARAKVHA